MGWVEVGGGDREAKLTPVSNVFFKVGLLAAKEEKRALSIGSACRHLPFSSPALSLSPLRLEPPSRRRDSDGDGGCGQLPWRVAIQQHQHLVEPCAGSDSGCAGLVGLEALETR